jgi:hypothetical protein
MTETAKLPMTGSAGRPLKMAEYLAEAERLCETVDAYRRARGGGADDVASKPERRKLPPLPRPTEIEGYPLNSTPPAEIEVFHSRAAVGHAMARRRAFGKVAQLDSIGPAELLNEARATRPGK